MREAAVRGGPSAQEEAPSRLPAEKPSQVPALPAARGKGQVPCWICTLTRDHLSGHCRFLFRQAPCQEKYQASNWWLFRPPTRHYKASSKRHLGAPLCSVFTSVPADVSCFPGRHYTQVETNSVATFSFHYAERGSPSCGRGGGFARPYKHVLCSAEHCPLKRRRRDWGGGKSFCERKAPFEV